MSMASGFGAASAAAEIMAEIDKLLQQYSTNETREALLQVRQRAEDIQRAGQSGWY